jgi:hypothetical protein
MIYTSLNYKRFLDDCSKKQHIMAQFFYGKIAIQFEKLEEVPTDWGFHSTTLWLMLQFVSIGFGKHISTQMCQESCTLIAKVSYEKRNTENINFKGAQIKNIYFTFCDQSSNKFFVLKPPLVSCLG